MERFKKFIKKYLRELISDKKLKTALWQITNTALVLFITYLSGLQIQKPIWIAVIAVIIAILNFTTKFININYLQKDIY